MTAVRLDGKILAAEMRGDLAADVRALTRPPGLAAVLVGENPASAVYVRNKQKACEEVGIATRLHRLPPTASQQELLSLVEKLNADPAVHGILVQLPLPPQIDEAAVIRAVSPAKDVDCFHPENLGLLAAGHPRFYPCTPHGVVKLVERAGIAWAGKSVVVVGRSNIVGKPLALMLIQKRTAANPAGGDATVTVAHMRTPDLTAVCRRADILVAAAGMPGLIIADMISPGTVVVDVGTNSVSGKLVGDVAADVATVAGHLSPVPGGVGPMTITMLLANTVRAATFLDGSGPGAGVNLNLTVATRYGLNCLALLGISVALYLGASIFIPLTISALLATILFPAAKWLHKRCRLPWFFACLSTILFLVLMGLAAFSAIGLSVPQLFSQLPAPNDETGWEKQYNETAYRLTKAVPFLTPDILPQTTTNPAFFQSVRSIFSQENLAFYLKWIGIHGLWTASELVLILFIALFLLLEAELLAKKVRLIFGTGRESQQAVSAALDEMAEAIRTYLVWRTIINFGLGIVVGCFYYSLGLKQYYLWGVLTILLSYVPYIGTIAAGVPPILEALLLHPYPEHAVLIIFVYTIIVTLEGYLIVPMAMGKSMDLNATTVMLACLYFSLVWGVAGLFLATPLIAALKSVMLHVEGWQPWGELLSSVETTPAAPPPDERTASRAVIHLPDDATVVMESPVKDGPPPAGPARS